MVPKLESTSIQPASVSSVLKFVPMDKVKEALCVTAKNDKRGTARRKAS